MKKAKFNVTRELEITEDQLTDLIANTVCDCCGVRWWKSENKQDYKDAKAELKAEGRENLCAEEIWSRMIFNGKKIMLLDPESDWDWNNDGEPEGGDWYAVGLEEIKSGLAKYFEEGYATGCKNVQKVLDEGDFWDTDAIFQYAMYGEVIYG